MRLGASVLAGVATSALSVGLLSVGLLNGVPPASADSTAVGTAPDRQSSPTAASTSLRIATFNVLGNSHTKPKGDEANRPSGKKRMKLAVQAINEGKPSIIGFQEMEGVQYKAFTSLTGGAYATYPGPESDQLVVANNLAWRTDTWRLLSATTFTVPYFYGKYSRRPLVLLQNVHTGQAVHVMNTHNPADVRGNAQQWRNQAVALEGALVTRLRSTHPDIPVLFTGDMNDWADFYCQMTARSPMHSAYPLSATPPSSAYPSCYVPRFTVPKGQSPNPIDWIMGTPDVTFSGATRLKDTTVATASDHPLYWADATIRHTAPPSSGISHVVTIDAEGLTAKALTKAGGADARFLNALRASGTSTLNARTEPDSTRVLPNAIGMLTGRKVLKAGGGHGVKGGDDGRTVARHAKGYVRSVYDVVHDAGRSTALYSSDPGAAMIKRSWTKHGAKDKVGANNGRKKINKTVIKPSDKLLLTSFRKGAKHLKSFTFVQLTDAVRAGEHKGFKSKGYRKAVKRVDHRIKKIVRTIQANPKTASNTMIVVTASAGGKGHSTAGMKKADYRVPFIVWGHGVPAGQDIYALNPGLLSPGSGNAGLTVGQPVRNAMVADLATSALRLPPVPGSMFDSGQDLNVLHAPQSTLPRDPAARRRTDR